MYISANQCEGHGTIVVQHPYACNYYVNCNTDDKTTEKVASVADPDNCNNTSTPGKKCFDVIKYTCSACAYCGTTG